MKKKKTKLIYKDAGTGEFVSKKYLERHKKATVSIRVKIGKRKK